MSEYSLTHEEQVAVVLERLALKGKGVLEYCLERGKTLCVKGFIDCQIEKGGAYVKVVEAMNEHITNELAHTHDRRRRALLVDLQRYAAEQLALAGPVELPAEEELAVEL